MRIPPIWSVGNITDKFYIIIREISKLELVKVDPLTPVFYFYSREVIKHNIHKLNN